MNRGVLLALLLIIAVVSVESGFGRSLRKRLKRIGKPFERAAKRVAEASAAGWIGKAAASIVGRRKRSEDEGAYRKLTGESLNDGNQWNRKY